MQTVKKQLSLIQLMFMSTNKKQAHKLEESTATQLYAIINEFQARLQAEGFNLPLQKLSFGADVQIFGCAYGTEVIIHPDGTREVRCKRPRTYVR